MGARKSGGKWDCKYVYIYVLIYLYIHTVSRVWSSGFRVLGHINEVTRDHAHGILRTNTVEIKVRSRFHPKTLQKRPVGPSSTMVPKLSRYVERNASF